MNICNPQSLNLGQSSGTNFSCLLQDVIDDGAVVFLLGNKIDAADKKASKVPKTEGERLAKVWFSVSLCLHGMKKTSL